MKKLIYKTAFFIAPFFLLYLISIKLYTTEKGDLLRLGYIANIYDYDFRELFKKEFERKINFTLYSDINLKKQNNFSVFVIGDSFSEQGNISYHNYLADNPKIKVLQLDRFLHENPIETTHGFLNGGIFENLKVEYIILQSVERSFVNRALLLKSNKIIHKDTLSKLIKKHKEKKTIIKKDVKKDDFFCRETIKFSLHNLNYNFDDNAYNSEVYKVKTCSNLFSINSSNLFFIEDDLKVVAINNVKQNIDKLNYELNLLAKKLNSKGIKLIVLPSPDKFDYYYDQIKNNSYPKPIFFNYFDKLEKTYNYINTKKLLTENGKNVEDMYIFDDTHWSPIAAKIIGNALNETIVADRINLK